MNMREMTDVIEGHEELIRHLEQKVADLRELLDAQQEKIDANAERLAEMIG